MANPPKAKGTKAESELRCLFEDYFSFPVLRRTSPGMAWDLESIGDGHLRPINVLATRPDRGQWLMTISLTDFLSMFDASGFLSAAPLRIESKRYKSFAHHRIYTEKFGS